MRSSWVLLALLAVVAAAFLLRGPIREWNARRSRKARERKRQWRKEREEQRARHADEHAMNRAKAAARSGPPSLQRVAKEHGSKCWLCGTRTYDDDRRRDARGNEEQGATFPVVDYVELIERGGTYELANARVAHRHCAAVRAARPAQDKFGTPPRTFRLRA